MFPSPAAWTGTAESREHSRETASMSAMPFPAFLPCFRFIPFNPFLLSTQKAPHINLYGAFLLKPFFVYWS
jgi:hypothetical protein